MRFLRLLCAVLREIFEESAYERYCATNGLSPGRDSYRSFVRQSTAERNSRVKCC
jgi:hypothetical protein